MERGREMESGIETERDILKEKERERERERESDRGEGSVIE